MLPGFCRACSEKIAIARACSTDALLAVYRKVGTDAPIPFERLVLELRLPANTDETDLQLRTFLLELVGRGALSKSPADEYRINLENFTWKPPFSSG